MGEEGEEEKQTYLMFRNFCHTGLGQCTRLPLKTRPLLCILDPVHLLGHLQSSIQCTPCFGSENFWRPPVCVYVHACVVVGTVGGVDLRVAKSILSICSNDIFTLYISHPVLCCLYNRWGFTVPSLRATREIMAPNSLSMYF